MYKRTICLVFIFICVMINTPNIFARGNVGNQTKSTEFDDASKFNWPKEFKLIEIPVKGESAQKCYFYNTSSRKPMPLVVSLHTWGGDYAQVDSIAILTANRNYNYIHPDFRGANVYPKSCCSELALADIDMAIDYAIAHGNVDATQIYVIGVSGGGLAALNMLMRSRHPIKTFSVWASISDLVSWYKQTSKKKGRYAKEILNCTNSKNGGLNVKEAQKRSPIFYPVPLAKLKKIQLHIFAGFLDETVPYIQSINFYNKFLTDIHVTDPKSYVSNTELRQLLNTGKPVGNFGNIDGRAIYLKKSTKHISLTIFDGVHEILTSYAFDDLFK